MDHLKNKWEILWLLEKDVLFLRLKKEANLHISRHHLVLVLDGALATRSF